MTYRVVVTARARADIVDIRDWIAGRADAATAEGYVDRVKRRLAALAEFPHRGTPRDELRPGVRSLSFERRLLIYYLVLEDRVRILRIVRAVRDQSELLDS